ncbi:MAG: sulfite exporter TauE/SafE family protein [Candidatus Dadabacteria bacterium]|nr:MAG: sulfite exporter TauE/SafE family protein [Candidatus Dadabacteria bacterium]
MMEPIQLASSPWLSWVGLAFGGLGSGIAAGLLGIGAGSLMVPILVFYLMSTGHDAGTSGQIAVASSLAAIVFLSSRAWLSHRARGAGQPRLIVRMLPGGIVGASTGALLAQLAGGRILLLAFAAFECIVGARYLIQRRQHTAPAADTIASWTRATSTGLCAGLISSFFGVGGGIVAVPLQIGWLRIRPHDAIANSSALIVFNALAGTVQYLLAPRPEVDLLTIGWVAPLPALCLILGGLLGAPVGVALAHRLSPARLKRMFGLFLLIVAALLARRALS